VEASAGTGCFLGDFRGVDKYDIYENVEICMYNSFKCMY
jgi:hypothetical protein